ncbi:retrovirus-related pol polyprotein from transposon TNT 1-94 [Tanacetum coccineum]
MSSECNNIKLPIWNDKSEVVCTTCKLCLIIANHDVFVLNYMNGMNSPDDKQSANVSNVANQKKHNPKVRKPKNLGYKERIASPKPSKPRSYLRWSPTGRIFDLKRKIIASSESECQSDSSKGDSTCTSNSKEPTSKQFSNSTLSLVVVDRRNRTLGEAAKTMLIFSCAPLFLWAEAIATSCYTQNYSIIHRLFDKTPYKLINDRKPDISFLHVFEAPCYPKNDRKDIGKLGAKGYIAFFLGYFANSCAYRVYNRRTNKIMEMMNVTFDELSAMAFEQRSSKPGLQSMTSGQIRSGLNLTYAPSTITSQKPTEPAPRTTPATPALQDVDELPQQQHVQQQDNQALLQPETVANNVPNAMSDEDIFENPFTRPSTSVAESSSS